VPAASATELAERLAAIVGDEHVAPAAEPVTPGLPTPIAVSPATLEEAAQALAAARAAGAAVAPHGGGTQQRIGAGPERCDVALRTERLRGVLDWEPGDLTAGLQAGLTLAGTQRTLAEQGQQLPIDAPVAERATLGGLVATNTAGPRRWAHGGWRDLVIGMEMALADGSVIKSGGRVVKNVQGYDLAKLFIGSLGTLGLIGRINVKLAPLPETRRIVVARGGLAPASTLCADVAGSQLRVAAVDLLNAEAAAACGLPVAGWAVLVLLEGRRAVVNGQSDAVSRLARSAGLLPDTIDSPALEGLWRRWVDLGSVDELDGHEALLTVPLPPAEATDAVQVVEREAAERGLRSRLWLRAGIGTLYARMRAADPLRLVAAQSALLRRWPATLLTAGSPVLAAAAKPWGEEPATLPVLRAIKQQFDPERVLNPGRFVGGI